jgi:prefoldin subunit 5
MGKAYVPDTSNIYVEAELGFFVEMPLEKALTFLDKKEAFLREKMAVQVKEATQMKAQIHEMLFLLGMLQQSE